MSSVPGARDGDQYSVCDGLNNFKVGLNISGMCEDILVSCEKVEGEYKRYRSPSDPILYTKCYEDGRKYFPISYPSENDILDEARNRCYAHRFDFLTHTKNYPTVSIAHDAFEESLNTLKEKNIDNLESCDTCVEYIKPKNVEVFQSAQHIKLSGENNHHAIIKQVLKRKGTVVSLELINFREIDSGIQIYQNHTVCDLSFDEIYIVDYKLRRYDDEEILSRLDSLLQNDNVENRTYNPLTTECGDFAAWCIIGERDSFQVQSLKQHTFDGIRLLLGDGSFLAKGVIGLLNLESDEIADRLNKSIDDKDINLEGDSAVYFLYCIVHTSILKESFLQHEICFPCFNKRMNAVWFAFDEPLKSPMVCHFALSLVNCEKKLPPMVILVLVSAMSQRSLPQVMNDFKEKERLEVTETAITNTTDLRIGDIVSFKYNRTTYVVIVSTIHKIDNNKCQIGVIHYGHSGVSSTREIIEEDFIIDLKREPIKRLRFLHALCYSAESVTKRARLRIGERKVECLVKKV